MTVQSTILFLVLAYSFLLEQAAASPFSRPESPSPLAPRTHDTNPTTSRLIIGLTIPIGVLLIILLSIRCCCPFFLPAFLRPPNTPSTQPRSGCGSRTGGNGCNNSHPTTGNHPATGAHGCGRPANSCHRGPRKGSVPAMSQESGVKRGESGQGSEGGEVGEAPPPYSPPEWGLKEMKPAVVRMKRHHSA